MSMKVITLENLTRFYGKLKDVFVQIKDSVRSVNGNFPDEDGDINVSRVNWAADLESESTQGSDAEFTVRTAGGEASIESGSAWLNGIFGKSVKNGYVPEVLEWAVVAIERENPITATLNENTFRAYVQSSQDITLTYTTDWNVSPTLYGFTITGTPVAGDQITVHYVKLDLGTIVNATPTAFVSTGWNQFDSVNGYARVINYGGSWRIDGNYSTVKFATTPTGTQSSLTVTGDIITGFPDNWTEGYVIVTDGDNSTTAIYPTWTDWDDGYAEHVDFAVFSKSTIDLDTVMNGDGDQVDGLFPYGLMAVGTSRDEINLNIAQAVSRIERMTNNETNMAEVIASGRPYDYDTGYIYVVRETPVTTALSGSYAVDGNYSVSDHGLEWFEGSEIPVPCQTIYGTSLKNKLERDVLTISQQSLTTAQQTQVRNNINAEKQGIGTSKTVNFNGLHSATTGVTSGLDALLDAELATMESGDRRGLNLVPAGSGSFVGNEIPFYKARHNYGVLTKNNGNYATYLGSDETYGNIIAGARSTSGWTFRGFGSVVDITSKCTSFEGGSAPANTKVYYNNTSVVIYYQGVSGTHEMGDALFTLPEGFRPSNNIYVPFTKNGVAYGTVQIGTNGAVAVNQISSTTASGRIYFHCVFPVSGL